MPAKRKVTTRSKKQPSAIDIVVYGATGFTGQLTASYLAEHAPAEASIALAGRNMAKLKNTQDQLAKQCPRVAEFALLQADSHDPESLQQMADSARVIITTVGPYIHYGEGLVHACASAGTDYVDLTGEPEFVDRMRAKYHDLATQQGARIVNSCGFDSIPHDVGVLYTVQQLTAKHGALTDKSVEVNGYVSAGGRFSGGTWHSAVNAFARFREHEQFKKRHYQQLKMPLQGRSVKAKATGLHRVGKRWALPFPTIDPQVVRRSAKLRESYGKAFSYSHNVLTKSLAKAVGGVGFVGGVFALAQLKPTRKFLLNRIDPGEGPSAEQRQQGWFEVRFTTQVDGKPSLETLVSGGDPGYGETSKMLAESALCLAFDRAQLPAGLGVTTPVGAMGEALLKRLQAAGIQFSQSAA